MAPQNSEIRSTERLLEIIRAQGPGPASPDVGSTPSTPHRAIFFSKSALSAFSFQKKITIGVDIGHTHIKLAKVVRSDKSHELVDYLDIPFKSSISIKDGQILKALKSALDQFCSETKTYDIWGAIQSANVETHCIRIPKLSRKQIPNAIYWTFIKKSPFDKTQETLDYQILGDVNEGGIKKTQVLVFKAPKDEIATFREAFHKIGYPLKGISIAPFAIQNLFRANIIDYAEEDVCCLFIGRDWSRIAIYNQGNLVLSRGIKAGMRSMIEAVNAALQRDEDRKGGLREAGSEREDDFEHSSLALYPKAQRIFFDFIGVPASNAGDTSESLHLDQVQVFQMIVPAMERLIRQVERTFEHYALNFTTEGVKRIFISGQIIAHKAIVNHFEQQLDLPVVPMNPFPADSLFTRHIRIPDKVWDKESYVPAIGLALSSNTITPNFLFTHEDKDVVENVRRNNMRILTICMLALMVMIAVFSWQQNQLDAKRQEIDKMENQLMIYNPPADKTLLLALFARTKQKRRVLSEIVRRYTPAAVVAELSRLTPSNVRLLNIDAAFGVNDGKRSDTVSSDVTIEGLVFGDAGTFETSLASYLLTLKNSPMFQRPNVQSKQIEYYNDRQVLHFSTRLEIL